MVAQNTIEAGIIGATGFLTIWLVGAFAIVTGMTRDCCCKNWEASGIEMVTNYNVLFGTINRIIVLVCIPILFSGLNATMGVVQQNQQVLEDYEPFNSYNDQCGDPLNNLNMKAASAW